MAVKNIDLSYCLLSDVGCGEFNNGSLSIDSEKKYKHIRFMINNQTYRAPDLFSAKLYRWQKEFFEERFPSCTTSFDTDKYSNGKITVQVLRQEVSVYMNTWQGTTLARSFSCTV